MQSDALSSFPYWDRRFSTLDRLRPRSREGVLNVFTPASMITEPAKFVGRVNELEAMINALHSQNANLMVFGERGAGKSSLARMFFEIVSDNFEILDYYGLRERLEKKGLILGLRGQRKRFNAIWVDGFNKNLNQVIHSILTRRPEPSFGQGLLFYLRKEADKKEVTSKLGIDSDLFNASAQVKEVFSSEKPETVKEAFEVATQRYASDYSEDLIILIDEFETIKDGREISQYLKSAHARFVLVGIADKVGDLVSQHASVAREAYGIRLESMRNEELGMILEVGSYLLQGICKIHEDAKREIIRNSYNSPYWCHLLARAAILDKMESEGTFEDFREINPTIRAFDVRQVIPSLAKRPETSIFEGLLQDTPMSDERLRKILLHMAKTGDNIMYSSKLADEIAQTEGIPRDITIKVIEDFLKLKAEPFREHARVLDSVSFSFQDPNFKRYIQIRNAGLPTPRLSSAAATSP